RPPRPRRGRGGPRRRGGTRSSSPPPAPVRPSPRSCGRSAGSRPGRRRSRPTGAGCSTSPRPRPSPSTSSATCPPRSGPPATRLGLPAPDITVGMRTGDTPADERRQFARTPPDVLVTTPESLFLLLTSAAREALRGVETVIVDEVHAVAGTKRGAHLALSLERLDELLPRPAQRIGLSATVRPVDEVSTFLAGGRPVSVVRPPAAKTIEVRVEVPVEDMTERSAPADDADDPDAPRRPSIWP